MHVCVDFVAYSGPSTDSVSCLGAFGLTVSDNSIAGLQGPKLAGLQFQENQLWLRRDGRHHNRLKIQKTKLPKSTLFANLSLLTITRHSLTRDKAKIRHKAHPFEDPREQKP